MRVFVAGATGAIGRRLVPLLLSRGHEVVGTTRTPSKEKLLRNFGAIPVVVDALDASAVLKAVTSSRPDVLVHQLTAIPAQLDIRRFDRDFSMTNLLRTVGTDNLLAASRSAGIARFVAQSYAGWPFARSGGPIKAEEDPLDDDPPESLRSTLEAIKYLERAVLNTPGMNGIVLRYGGFYGPGTSLDFERGGGQVEAIRKRKFPIIGGGSGVWSFVHVEDAAAATVLAVEKGRSGIYQIVDDDPAPAAEWLSTAAGILGTKPPIRMPAWLGRALAGDVVVHMMTAIRGASNGKAKRELGWVLKYPTWRHGFAQSVAQR